MMIEVQAHNDISSAFRGVTTPLSDLQAELGRRGWETKVEFSNGIYKVVATSANGDKVERNGPTPQTAVGNALEAVIRKDHIRRRAQHKVGMWQTQWTDQLEQVATAYSNAPIYDPKAASAWQELAQDSMHRAEVLKQQLKVEVVDDPEPYASQQEMCQDIHQNQHFLVSRANCDHPVWSVEQNVAFRIVHDVLGHCVSGGDFGWEGENRACAAHFPLLSPNAQKALFTECIGQTAYAAFYRGFGPQKVAFLDEFLDPVQQAENDPAHTGIHPSQSLAPIGMPEVPDSPGVETPYKPEDVAPHQEALGLTPVFTTVTSLRDPNHEWQPNVEPTAAPAYTHHRDVATGRDPLDAKASMDNAGQIDTQWWKLDPALQKQAIVNAFRVVLLSPRKDLRWNAVHYQDIAHIPAEVDDPRTYWDALETRRQHHNRSRGRHEQAHVSYWKPLQRYYQLFNQWHPDLSPEEAKAAADNEVFHIRQDLTKRYEDEEKNKRGKKQLTDLELELKVQRGITKWLKEQTKLAYDAAKDFPAYNRKREVEIHPEQQGLDFAAAAGQQDIFTGDDADLYGAFMSTHLNSISMISRYVDQILEAALEDIAQGGTGHIFRSNVLGLGIPGVGPKVASFAWLLLAPRTSQLATIDTHMMDVLGHNFEKEMNPRDYFKFERELAAGREAAGYGHMPLGQFQWSMWDYKRTGPGTHQDHSAIKVLDPVPHHQVDWQAKAQPVNDRSWHDQAPSWWLDTLPARQQVSMEYDNEVAANHAADSIPFKTSYNKPFKYWWDKKKPFDTREADNIAEYAKGKHLSRQEFSEWLDSHKSDVRGDFDKFKDKALAKFKRLSKVAAVNRRPYYQDGPKKRYGDPGQSLMHHLVNLHGLSTPEIWAHFDDDVVGKEDHDGDGFIDEPSEA